jgi:hypothetical protein
MGAMTRTRQLTTAGKGLAVGLLSVDALPIPTDEAAAAFRYAWQRWAYAYAFPQVRADMFRNDILLQLVGRPQRTAARTGRCRVDAAGRGSLKCIGTCIRYLGTGLPSRYDQHRRPRVGP